MATQRIKLTIASRQYPLTVPSEEEEIVRQAAKEINDTLKIFEEKYAVSDKQDALAMAVIQYATKDFKWRKKAESSNQIQTNDLEDLITKIDQALAIK